MKKIAVLLFAVSCCSFPFLAQGQNVQKKKEPLVAKVKHAIDTGVAYLKRHQLENGGWDVKSAGIQYNVGGSCLAMLALLESGVPLNDMHIQRGLDYVRGIRLRQTYTVALQTMVLAKAGLAVDREKIQQNVDWLIDARSFDNGEMMGWSYGSKSGPGDGSNSQYALLGLWAGKEAGAKIPDAVWKSVRGYYTEQQVVQRIVPAGGAKAETVGYWLYRKGTPTRLNDNHMTMTTAGVSGLIIAGTEIKEGRETLKKNAPALNCGSYKDNSFLSNGINWLSHNFSKEVPGRTFYNLYGIERAGRLSGLRFFGNHDWYREGCEYLVNRQNNDGTWYGSGSHDRFAIVSTSFALLFLSKGRTPILVSRIVHGAWPRNQADIDWNRDRHAMRNLTKFSSEQLFKRMPLGWQNFDIMRAVMSNGGARTEEEILEITSELLQSPVAFINGHDSPERRFTDKEITILQKYVENGGFIIAEACCGDKIFDAGFRQLMQQMFPTGKLAPLKPNHPIWKAHFLVPPGSFKLEGLQMGCKTVLVYAPEDMSCRWEGNLTKDTNFEGRLAFRLGANIIAYATGLEPPKPRLTVTELGHAKIALPPRGFLRVAQIQHAGDWQPAPNAMRNLMDHLRKYAGLDAALEPITMKFANPKITNYKFLYLHGRGDPKFDAIDEKHLEHLKFNLETGGLLFADACCGNETFDKKFRAFVAKLFPKHKLKQVPYNDVLFNKSVAGLTLSEKNIRYRQERGGPLRNAAPWLEGIKIDGQWAILYSKYDIGCALERHQSSDCLGYDFESAKKISRAAVLYLLRP